MNTLLTLSIISAVLFGLYVCVGIFLSFMNHRAMTRRFAELNRIEAIQAAEHNRIEAIQATVNRYRKSHGRLHPGEIPVELPRQNSRAVNLMSVIPYIFKTGDLVLAHNNEKDVMTRGTISATGDKQFFKVDRPNGSNFTAYTQPLKIVKTSMGLVNKGSRKALKGRTLPAGPLEIISGFLGEVPKGAVYKAFTKTP